MIHKHTTFVRPEVVSVPSQSVKAREFANNLAALAQDLSIWSLKHFKCQERLKKIFQDFGSQLDDRQVRRFCEVSRTAHRTETSISVEPTDTGAKVYHPVMASMSFYNKGKREPLITLDFWFDEGACIYRHMIVDKEAQTTNAHPPVNSGLHPSIALDPSEDGEL